MPHNPEDDKALQLTSGAGAGYGLTMTTATPSRRHGITATAASAFVLCLAIGFYGYSARLNGSRAEASYELQATFLSSNGLHEGADVVLAGVVVGRVTGVTLNQRTMTSDVTFHLDDALRLPVDTRLSIGSSSLTSGSALLVDPGRSHQMLSSGATLTDTCEPISLEQQVSQYIFGNAGAASGCSS